MVEYFLDRPVLVYRLLRIDLRRAEWIGDVLNCVVCFDGLGLRSLFVIKNADDFSLRAYFLLIACEASELLR